MKHGLVHLSAVLLGLGSFCGTLGCASARPSHARDTLAAALVRELHNDDIDWHGTLVGLMANIEGRPAKQLLAMGWEAVPDLVAATDDPDRFVAAHVLLSEITNVDLSHLKPDDRTNASVNNGLRVELVLDGCTLVRVPASEIPVVSAEWRKWYAERWPAVHRVLALRNDDVKWRQTPSGPLPTVQGSNARDVLAQGEAAVPFLLDAMDDPRRFVAAHVLLTLITEADLEPPSRYIHPPEGKGFNGLRVAPLPGGGARVCRIDSTRLRRAWEEWRESESPAPSVPANNDGTATDEE